MKTIKQSTIYDIKIEIEFQISNPNPAEYFHLGDMDTLNLKSQTINKQILNNISMIMNFKHFLFILVTIQTFLLFN